MVIEEFVIPHDLSLVSKGERQQLLQPKHGAGGELQMASSG